MVSIEKHTRQESGTEAAPIRKLRKATLKMRFKHIFTRGLRPAMNHLLARYSVVGNQHRLDPALFFWTREFEARHTDIRAEILRLSALHDCIPAFHEISPYQKRISKGSSWKTLWLRGFGTCSPTAAELCPVTAALLERVPGLETACFSILTPGTHIRGHRGVFKGLINYHLGVIVPEQAEECRIKLGDETFHWEEGRSYVFDDTYRHEVWNESGEERVVLFLQFRRPFRQPGQLISEALFWILRWTPYVRRPRANIEANDRMLRSVAKARGILDDSRSPADGSAADAASSG